MGRHQCRNHASAGEAETTSVPVSRCDWTSFFLHPLFSYFNLEYLSYKTSFPRHNKHDLHVLSFIPGCSALVTASDNVIRHPVDISSSPDINRNIQQHYGVVDSYSRRAQCADYPYGGVFDYWR